MTTFRRRVARAALLAVCLTPLGLTGCLVAPLSMGIFTPIPVPPWVSDRMEEKYGVAKNDYRTAILPPIRPGYPEPLCEDPPDEAAVVRTADLVPRGVPYIYEVFVDDLQIVTERLVDRIDPPRYFPLIGWARLHHCHYKCTLYYTETIQSGYPFPFKVVKPRVKVVYIDKDHLHLEPGGNPEAWREVSRDMFGY